MTTANKSMIGNAEQGKGSHTNVASDVKDASIIATLKQGEDSKLFAFAASNSETLKAIVTKMLAMPQAQREEKLHEKLANKKPPKFSSQQFDEELVIREVDRPSLLVKNGQPEQTQDRHWAALLEEASHGGWLLPAIEAVGRIDNRDLGHVGTGCLVRKDVIVTNAHVARELATRTVVGNTRYRLVTEASPTIDFGLEDGEESQHRSADVFRIVDVLHVDATLDLAFFRIEAVATRTPLRFTPASLPTAGNEEMAVVGFPAAPPRSLLSKEERAKVKRVFGSKFGVKRLAVGKVFPSPVESSRPAGSYFAHDASTLWGSSGSLVLHLATGRPLGIHFGNGGFHANFAHNGAEVARLLDQLP